MRLVLTALSFLVFAGCAGGGSDAPQLTDDEVEKRVWTKGAMVAAADARAVEAGLDVLRRGGHAVDAAIAVHAVLGLVEPQSSGLGGGAFMVVYERETGEITVFDGREAAPLAIDDTLFLKPDGEPLGFIEAWQSGRSVGVPGQVALYGAAHEQFGQVGWETLFVEATRLADEGFEVSPRLAELLSSERLRRFVRLDDEGTASADYFYPDGEPLQVGDVRTNPAYAETLRRLASDGAGVFYEGPLADAMIAAARSDAVPSALTLKDFADYEVIEREPLCGQALGYRLCSAPPPSSGGVTQIGILGLYERFKAQRNAVAGEAGRLQDWVDAQRLSYADRDHYVADGDQVFVPATELVDPRYLDVRAGERFAPDEKPVAGDPGVALGKDPFLGLWGSQVMATDSGTTHISIIDSDGNAVSMTATVEAPFGSSIWVPEGGFVLNNELTDFSFRPVIGGKPVANAPAPGKRPRSSMSPTLVFDGAGDLFMVTGSPGGNSIVGYVSKSLIGVLDWELSAQEAIDLPNVIARGERVNVEIDRANGPEVAQTLRDLGYDVNEREGENSGLHVIIVREDGLEGGADPRREGTAQRLDEG